MCRPAYFSGELNRFGCRTAKNAIELLFSSVSVRRTRFAGCMNKIFVFDKVFLARSYPITFTVYN